MKWMVASDIHGSLYYAKQMLQAFDREGADRLLLLGDILYHGPRNDLPKDYAPKDVIQLLNERKDCIFAIRGNCDTEVDQMVLEFPIMADYCILAMDGSNSSNVIYASHGHQYNPQNIPPLKRGDILLNGHTHIPACIEYDNYVYMNPGSVSIPKEGSEHSYMTIEDGTFIWKNLEGKSWKSWSDESYE